MASESVYDTYFREKSVWTQQVNEVLEYFGEHADRIKPNPHLLTIEGIDGTGKTTLARNLATHLKTKLGLKVVMMRGSGTTGTEELIEWTKSNYSDSSERNEILADHNQILGVQGDYKSALVPQAKVVQGVKMQGLMFAATQKYLDKGYWVVSDRGILSAFLGARERVDSSATFQKVASIFPTLPLGPSILVDNIPINDVMGRLAGKAEQPDALDLLRKKHSFVHSFSRMSGQLEGKVEGVSPNWFMTLNGSGNPQEMRQQAIDLLTARTIIPQSTN